MTTRKQPQKQGAYTHKPRPPKHSEELALCSWSAIKGTDESEYLSANRFYGADHDGCVISQKNDPVDEIQVSTTAEVVRFEYPGQQASFGETADVNFRTIFSGRLNTCSNYHLTLKPDALEALAFAMLDAAADIRSLEGGAA